MSGELKSDIPQSSDAGPTASRSTVPIWIIVLTLLLSFLGTVYFDHHSGWFDKQVYAPYTSAAELASSYEKASGKQWTATLGFSHAIFEVALDVVKRSKDISDPKAILDAIVSTDLQTIVGPVKWTGKPVKNVTKTPLAGGQWVRKNGKFELVVVADPLAPQIPIGGKLKLLGA